MEQYCNEIRLEGLGKEPAAKRILRGTVRATGSGCEIHLRLASLTPMSVSSDLLCLTNSMPAPGLVFQIQCCWKRLWEKPPMAQNTQAVLGKS